MRNELNPMVMNIVGGTVVQTIHDCAIHIASSVDFDAEDFCNAHGDRWVFCNDEGHVVSFL